MSKVFARAAWLGSAVGLALTLAGPGAAQPQNPAEAAEDLVYLEADDVTVDEETGRYIARGGVVISYGGRTLYADEVTVFPDENRVRATGNVRIEDSSGVVSHADEAEFSQDLNAGVLDSPLALLPGNGTAGAAIAVRRGGSINELRRAYYTVCDLCDEEGEPRRPTWRLRARRVTQDEDAQMLYYRDAVLEIKGVPILYTPFFAHADPSSERRSGFLLPYFGESSRTGFFYEQPYYWALSPSQDLTLAPRLMSNANPIVAFEHRKRFFSGGSLIQGSLTYEAEFDDDGETFGEQKWRGHLFTDSQFEITPEWSWGLAIERVSDDLYFRRYEIDDAEADRGLYRRNSKRLLSQVYVEGVGDHFYSSLAGLTYQGLRAGDDEDEFPVVLPVGMYERTIANDLFGGRLVGGASVAVLERHEGADSRRATAELDWRRQFIAPGGVVAEPFAFARADVYSIGDYTTDGGEVVNDVIGRELGYVGAQVSWPFGRSAGQFDLVVEPVAQVVFATDEGNDPRIPNNDSLVTELDEANIFEPNRAPGYDLWEEGSHAVLGARAAARWGARSEASLFLGQSYRAEEAYEFPDTSGVTDEVSDLVGAATLELDPRRRVSARFRLDHTSLDISRLDVDAVYSIGRASVSTKYLRFRDDDTSFARPREELSMSAGVEFTEHLGAYYSATLDLDEDEARYAFLGLVYDDECSRFEIIYKRDGTRDRALNEGDSIRLQFTLNSIGTFGQGR